MTDGQEQKGGDHSQNLQVAGSITVTTGLSYHDVRDIVEDVFRSSVLDTLRGDARAEAERRANEILDEFIEKLRAAQAAPPASVNDPDMLFALTDAQKAYARSGEAELAHVLTDILVRRSQEPQRTTLQLVLNESLQVAPKLNVHHFDLLTLAWIIRYVSFVVFGRKQLFDTLALYVEPFTHELRLEDSTFSHLQYAGCGAVELGQASLTRILMARYPAIFSGAQEDPDIERQFRAHSALLNEVAEYWKESPAKNFTLTSVGVAVANAHFTSRFKDAVSAPLTIWIK